MLWWHANYNRGHLFTAASTITFASRAIKAVLQTRVVIVADSKYNFDRHPIVVCLVVAFWLFLAAIMIFAAAAVLSDLPSLIEDDHSRITGNKMGTVGEDF